MEYFVAFLPIILLLLPKRMFKKGSTSNKDVIDLLEGAEVDPPRVESDLYRVAKLLLEAKKLYGAKAIESLIILKKEAYEGERANRRLRGIIYGAYFQQLVMALLILVMILITRSMFESTLGTYVVILLLQVCALLILQLSNYFLDKLYIRGGMIRLKNLLIVKSLSQSGLSVGRVLQNIDWEGMENTSTKQLSKWDEFFTRSLFEWKESGSGLLVNLHELEEELDFLRTFGDKKFQDYMNGAKFFSLLVGGFLGYFVYLFSFVDKLLS